MNESKWMVTLEQAREAKNAYEAIHTHHPDILSVGIGIEDGYHVRVGITAQGMSLCLTQVVHVKGVEVPVRYHVQGPVVAFTHDFDYQKGYDLGYQDAKDGISALTLTDQYSSEYVHGYKEGYQHGSI